MGADQQDINEAWTGVISILQISKEQLLLDITDITQLLDMSTAQRQDALSNCMLRLMAIISGYAVGREAREDLHTVQANMTILVLDFIEYVLINDGSKLPGLSRYGELDNAKMLEAMKA